MISAGYRYIARWPVHVWIVQFVRVSDDHRVLADYSDGVHVIDMLLPFLFVVALQDDLLQPTCRNRRLIFSAGSKLADFSPPAISLSLSGDLSAVLFRVTATKPWRLAIDTILIFFAPVLIFLITLTMAYSGAPLPKMVSWWSTWYRSGHGVFWGDHLNSSYLS